jgi:hypothetical protein
MGPVGKALSDNTISEHIRELEQTGSGPGGMTAIQSLTLAAYESAAQSRQALQAEKEPDESTVASDGNILERLRREAEERKAAGKAFTLTT